MHFDGSMLEHVMLHVKQYLVLMEKEKKMAALPQSWVCTLQFALLWKDYCDHSHVWRCSSLDYPWSPLHTNTQEATHACMPQSVAT